MRLITTRRFERDLRRAGKRNKDLDKLWAVVERLVDGKPLEHRHRPHRLSGNGSPFLECQLEPDWLLIWSRGEDTLVLVRTGTHADLFG